MLPISYALLCTLFAAGIKAEQCAVVEPRFWIFEALLIGGEKTWHAQEQYGTATILSSKCYSIGYYLQDYSLLHNEFDAPYRYYDERNTKQAVNIRTYVIGNKAKYYAIVNNKEITLTLIALNWHWIVFYGCQEGEGAVIILTMQKTRNERLIAEATEAARKVVRLPSHSKDMHCNSTDL
ncbi:unnamed protein product [Callosobruchus maculatus]|uniref:Lipocalin/cytosolic fatty-acid binding domain-containing protein n=1 Tax=Callosobruchus maculatus TaxID=64391 RepID=A0A653CVM0_CALMS|nr:unnamed protein product [Callosobruchus maculatus]